MPFQFRIQGRRWFNPREGNSYHSVRITDSEGKEVAYLPFQYGYGDQYVQTGMDWLFNNGHLERPEKHLFPREMGVLTEVIDVQRKKDL